MSRVYEVVGDLWSTTSVPTKTHIRGYELAEEESAPVFSNLKTLVNVDLAWIEDSMEVVAALWTP